MQKKQTKKKKENYLKSIAESLDSIRISLALLVSSNALIKEIETHKEKKSWAEITDDGSKKTLELLAECKSLFPFWSFYSDEELDKLCPAPKQTTTRKFQENIEPDAETLGKSTNEADPRMKGITLRERIIMELQYFKETNNHLDIKGATFCSGSRDAGGDVPSAYWFGGRFGVSYRDLDGSGSEYGIRSEVAL